MPSTATPLLMRIVGCNCPGCEKTCLTCIETCQTCVATLGVRLCHCRGDVRVPRGGVWAVRRRMRKMPLTDLSA